MAWPCVRSPRAPAEVTDIALATTARFGLPRGGRLTIEPVEEERLPSVKPIGDGWLGEGRPPGAKALSGAIPRRATAAAATALTAAAVAAALAISAVLVAEPRLRTGTWAVRLRAEESPPSSLSCCRRMRRILEFQWFLIALSVRPGSIWAILAHLVPICCTSSMISWSSSSVSSSLLTEGHTWLCHLRANDASDDHLAPSPPPLSPSAPLSLRPPSANTLSLTLAHTASCSTSATPPPYHPFRLYHPYFPRHHTSLLYHPLYPPRYPHHRSPRGSGAIYCSTRQRYHGGCALSGCGGGGELAPFPALLAHPAGQLVGDHGPGLRPVVLHELQQLPVLLRRPRALEDTLARQLPSLWIARIARIAAWLSTWMAAHCAPGVGRTRRDHHCIHCLSAPRGEPRIEPFLWKAHRLYPVLHRRKSGGGPVPVALRLDMEWQGDRRLGGGAGRVKVQPRGQRGGRGIDVCHLRVPRSLASPLVGCSAAVSRYSDTVIIKMRASLVKF